MTFAPATSGPNVGGMPASASLRHRLRKATAAAHHRLDARFALLNLTKLPDYRRFLEANATALLPLEDALVTARVIDLFADWPVRRRRLAIMDDLHAIDGDLAPLPCPSPLDFEGVLGTMYVLEGSRLGGKVLLSKVTRSQNPRVVIATKYLRHGADAHLWTGFLAALEQHGATLGDISGVVDSALRAFALFEHAAEQHGLTLPSRSRERIDERAVAHR